MAFRVGLEARQVDHRELRLEAGELISSRPTQELADEQCVPGVLDENARVQPVRRVGAQYLSHRPAPDPLDTLSVLFEFESGVSGMLGAVRSTPAFWRVHVFGRDGSAEALGRTELVLRKSGKAPERRLFQPLDSVRANLEAFADAVAGRVPYPISPREMVDVVAAFEAIVKSVGSHGRVQDV